MSISALVRSNYFFFESVYGSFDPNKLFLQIDEIESKIDEVGLGDIIVLGPRVQEQQEIVNNFGLFSTDKSKLSKKNQELGPLARNGSVLGVTPWSLMMNDSFILSAVHSNKTFYITKNCISNFMDQELWNEADMRPTVFGRELMLILQCGYTISETPCGIILSPPSEKNLAIDRSFLSRFYKVIGGVHSAEEIKCVLSKRLGAFCDKKLGRAAAMESPSIP